MPEIIPRRVTANINGDFVVFRIGMRINAFWKIHTWLPVFLGMLRMLSELEEDSDIGLLGYQSHNGLRHHDLTQYWRSYDHLREYAQDADGEHLPAWERFNEEIGSGGEVGIWHETFLVRDGEYEAVYNNMPPYGLGEFAEVVPATGQRQTSAGRLGRTGGEDAPVQPDGTRVTWGG